MSQVSGLPARTLRREAARSVELTSKETEVGRRKVKSQRPEMGVWNMVNSCNPRP